MPKVYYGTSELERGWERYYERSNLFEIALSGGEHDPSVKTLNRWRVNSPKGFSFVLHATPELSQALVRGHKRDDASWSEELNAAWEETTKLAHACAAKAILIATPMEFSPGETDLFIRTTGSLSSDAIGYDAYMKYSEGGFDEYPGPWRNQRQSGTIGQN